MSTDEKQQQIDQQKAQHHTVCTDEKPQQVDQQNAENHTMSTDEKSTQVDQHNTENHTISSDENTAQADQQNAENHTISTDESTSQVDQEKEKAVNHTMSTGESSAHVDEQKDENHAASTDESSAHGEQKAENHATSTDENSSQFDQQRVENHTMNTDESSAQVDQQKAEDHTVSTDENSSQVDQQKIENQTMSTEKNLSQIDQQKDRDQQKADDQRKVDDQQKADTSSTDENLAQVDQQKADTTSTDENLPQVDKKKSELDYSDYYNYLLRNPWIQQVIATYDWTKHRSKLLESTLDRVETGVSTVAQSVTKKVFDVHQNYYVRPKEAITSACSTGVEKTMSVVETSKNIVVKGGTFGIGAAVVATQLSLAISAGGALLILNSIEEAQKAGKNLLSSIREAEKGVEEKIWNAVEDGLRTAKVPVDKVADGTNIFLDVVSVLLERSLGIAIEEPADSSVKQRVGVLAKKIVETINNKAHSEVIDPVSTQLRGLLEQLRKSFILVDVVRAKREWALEKVGELSTSVHDLKVRIENEAREYRSSPEDFLMKNIRSASSQLMNNLQALKDKQIFGDGTMVESAIAYLQELDKNLGEAKDIYEVRDEVLSEARQRLSDLTTWVSNLLSREKQ